MAFSSLLPPAGVVFPSHFQKLSQTGVSFSRRFSFLSSSEQLEQLFLKWELAQENESDSLWQLTKGGNNITKSHFRRDGIIDEAVFAKETRKTLFISNEANDDEYSAKTNAKPNNIDDYRRYCETGYDDWLGKMRERTSALYKIVAGIGIMEMSDADAALHYAVMDLNKRGGGSDVKSAAHIEEYCKYYQNFIKREIEIINPDVVVWLGTKTYDMELHSKYLGAECEKDKRYFIIDHKKVPILRMWHTSYYQGHIEPLPGYSNRIVGKLCAKCLEELEKYNISLF